MGSRGGGSMVKGCAPGGQGVVGQELGRSRGGRDKGWEGQGGGGGQGCGWWGSRGGGFNGVG